VSAGALLAAQLRATNRSFWRNPAAATFTFAFPLVFLVVFTTLLGQGETVIGGTSFDNSTYYVAAMATFGVITACETNLAMGVVVARDAGVLKRVRGTPMPPWLYLSARVTHAMLIGFLLVAITVAFGVIAYEAQVPTGIDLVRFVASLLVGAGCFAALGLAVSGIVPNAEAAPAIVNGIILPLLFVSGVFVPIGDDAPSWVNTVADIFPVRHFFDTMRDSFLGTGSFAWSDVGVMALWLAIGIVVAMRTFRWESRR
jgi:ABC-2 type transport system permease protein